MERVLIEGGRRSGRTLTAEPAFRSAIAKGQEVYTLRNGVYFAITPDGEAVVYTALAERPEGI